MKAVMLGVVAALVAASTQTARAGEPVTLERKLVEGARVKVTDRRTTVTQLTWKGQHAKVGDAKASEAVKVYVEEVRRAQPEVLVREFELATRSEHHPQDQPEPVKTALSGRRILVAGLEWKPDEPFEIPKEDREALKLERLPAALLPSKQVVAARERWTVSAEELGEALFGAFVPKANLSGQAKVELRAVREREGRQVAVLRVRLQLHVDRTHAIPEIDLELRGDVEWAVAEGCLLGAELDGPLAVVIVNQKERTELHSDATLRWRYAAEVLAARDVGGAAARSTGAPPPPGTTALRCSLHDEHRYPLEGMTRCMLCGEPLDRERRCAKGCPWALQFCPRDGAALRPE